MPMTHKQFSISWFSAIYSVAMMAHLFSLKPGIFLSCSILTAPE